MNEEKQTHFDLARLFREHHKALEEWCIQQSGGEPGCKENAVNFVMEAFYNASKVQESMRPTTAPEEWLREECRKVMEQYLRKRKEKRSYLDGFQPSAD